MIQNIFDKSDSDRIEAILTAVQKLYPALEHEPEILEYIEGKATEIVCFGYENKNIDFELDGFFYYVDCDDMIDYYCQYVDPSSFCGEMDY